MADNDLEDDNFGDDEVTLDTTRKLVRRTRFIKLLNTLIFLIFVIIVLVASNPNTTGYKMVSYVITALYIIGGVYFLSIICGSNNLHYVYVKRKSIKGFTNFVIPECTIEDTQRTIKSVSALTATFGSNAHNFFSRFAYATVGAVFATIIIHWNEIYDKEGLNEKLSMILMLCGIFGNGLYGTWALEGPNNYLSSTMHYACAPLIFVLQTLAYAIQQKWSALSVFLFVLGLILDIIYVIVLYGFAETSPDLKKVHRISIYCIVSEFSALAVPCIAVVLFVYSL